MARRSKRIKTVNNAICLLKIRVVENKFKRLLIRLFLFRELDFLIKSYDEGKITLKDLFETKISRSKISKEENEELLIKLSILRYILDKYNYYNNSKSISILKEKKEFLKEAYTIIHLINLNKFQYIRLYEKYKYNLKSDSLYTNLKQYKNFITVIKKKLVEHNRFLVANLAQKYMRNKQRSLTIEDLVQEGSVGLIKAINLVDPLRNIKLSTYAYNWIRLYIGRAIKNQSKLIRVPIHMVTKINLINKLEEEFLNKYDRKPTDLEICTHCDINPKDYKVLKAYKTDNTTSIDDKPNISIHKCPEKDIIHENTIQLLYSNIDKLDDDEKFVIIKKFNLSLDKPSIIIKRNSIELIEQRAMKKLKNLFNKYKSSDLLIN